MAQSEVLHASTKTKSAKGVSRYSIVGSRFLSGHYHRKDKEVFVIDHKYEAQYIKAEPDAPVTIEVPDGYKVDSGMRDLEDGEPQAELLKPAYFSNQPVLAIPGAPAVVEQEAKSKRPSDKSPV